MIKVAVCGADGKMGKEVVNAVESDNRMELVATIDISGNSQYKTIKEANKYCDFDVLVDFTKPLSIYRNAKYCLSNDINIVIGTTGLTEVQMKKLKNLSEENQTGCLIAPNFSTGAVLMMLFSKIAAKYFDNAEIIEYHHNKKKDAPSGSAIKTALMMSQEKNNFQVGNTTETEILQGSRGGNSYSDIQIHSVRMPGFEASQEVIFGSLGQTLKIRHDTVNRKCYMDGVLMAIIYVMENRDYVYGLENLLY